MSSMTALRLLSRTAPTAARRVGGMRVPALPLRAHLSTNMSAGAMRWGLNASVAVSQRRAFSATTWRAGEGAADVALVQKLQEELKYEKDNANEESGEPEFLKAFKEIGVWAIEDLPGNDEITLSRKFGNENMRLMFSIADLQEDYENENDAAEDGSETLEDADEVGQAEPIRVSLAITKTNGPGALNIDMIAQEGHFIIDSIAYYKDAVLGTELTAEADWKRRGVYLGPQFDTLDVAVQEEFERFLQERGVNESVALFIPEYAEYKEHSEYVKWLGNVKSFIQL